MRVVILCNRAVFDKGEMDKPPGIKITFCTIEILDIKGYLISTIYFLNVIAVWDSRQN